MGQVSLREHLLSGAPSVGRRAQWSSRLLSHYHQEGPAPSAPTDPGLWDGSIHASVDT